jgi:hypothetical protein
LKTSLWNEFIATPIRIMDITSVWNYLQNILMNKVWLI